MDDHEFIQEINRLKEEYAAKKGWDKNPFWYENDKRLYEAECYAYEVMATSDDSKFDIEAEIALCDEDSPIWYEDDKCEGALVSSPFTSPSVSAFDGEADDAALLSDCAGAILAPGRPNECEGNGEDGTRERYCAECDYIMLCFPNKDY